MMNAIQLIAIQHELSMAIGCKVDLEPMLKHFIRTCNSLLNVSGVHVYLYHDASNHPIEVSSHTELANFKHYISLPEQHKAKKWRDSTELLSLAKDTITHESWNVIEIINRKFYAHSIPNHGVIIFESKNDISSPVLKSLKPITKKLALSCYSCISNSSLKKEIASRQLAEDIITHQAHHDELTQLQNRRKLISELNKSIYDCKKDKRFGALVYIDINEFRSVNDIMGHEVGDQLLKLIGARLAKLRKTNECISRFGGDEFAVLLPSIADNTDLAEKNAISFIQLINKTLSEAIVISKTSYTLDCSIGYEIFPTQGQSDMEIIKRADMAMYEAKEVKDKNYMRYSQNIAQKINDKLQYIEKLKSSVKRKEFTLYYQPQIDKNNQIVGAEALLRWDHPDHIQDSPAIYVPIAEESDLIHAIGETIIETACLHTKQLEDLGLPKSFERVSINVSAKQLASGQLVPFFKECIKNTGVTSNRIGIELTENVLIKNVDNVIHTLNEFKELGILCSIDDFGTGYSSLTYLKKLPSYAIKIDRSFVTNIDTDGDNQSIAQMIIALGQNLAMNIVAEGIETKDELACLDQLGCNIYQGYYFYKPMPFLQFKDLLKKFQ